MCFAVKMAKGLMQRLKMTKKVRKMSFRAKGIALISQNCIIIQK